jgi:hypothetical protein
MALKTSLLAKLLPVHGLQADSGCWKCTGSQKLFAVVCTVACRPQLVVRHIT